MSRITIDNFHISSVGNFKQVPEVPEVPEDFKLTYQSAKSSYYVDASNSILIRVSDHWGSKIKRCNWFLEG